MSHSLPERRNTPPLGLPFTHLTLPRPDLTILTPLTIHLSYPILNHITNPQRQPPHRKATPHNILMTPVTLTLLETFGLYSPFIHLNPVLEGIYSNPFLPKNDKCVRPEAVRHMYRRKEGGLPSGDMAR